MIDSWNMIEGLQYIFEKLQFIHVFIGTNLNVSVVQSSFNHSAGLDWEFNSQCKKDQLAGKIDFDVGLGWRFLIVSRGWLIFKKCFLDYIGIS